MGVYSFAAGILKPVLMECPGDEEWEPVGSIIPRAFHLCIYKLRDHSSSDSRKYRVQIALEHDETENIYCGSLSELLHLLTTLTPITNLAAADRMNHILQLELQAPEGAS